MESPAFTYSLLFVDPLGVEILTLIKQVEGRNPYCQHSELGQVSVPSAIHLQAAFMLLAVYLDANLGRRHVEVEKVRTDTMLPANSKAKHVLAHGSPKPLLADAHVATQLAGAQLSFRGVVDATRLQTLPPLPLPLVNEREGFSIRAVCLIAHHRTRKARSALTAFHGKRVSLTPIASVSVRQFVSKVPKML